MSQSVPVDILSDSDEDGCRRRPFQDDTVDLVTPPSFLYSKKKQRIETFANPSNSTILIIDDDPSPSKQHSSPEGATFSSSSFVADTPFSHAPIAKCSTTKLSSSGLATEQLVVPETPISELLKPEVSLLKCNTGVSNSEHLCSLDLKFDSPEKLREKSESDCVLLKCISSHGVGSSLQLMKKFSLEHLNHNHMIEGYSHERSMEDETSLGCVNNNHNAKKLETMNQITSKQDNDKVCKKQKDNNKGHKKQKAKADEAIEPKKLLKEERLRLMQEKKQQKELEKVMKAASKAEAANIRKHKKEMQKWEKGKYALKSIVAEIDRKVVELGSIGGQLLTRFSEKGVSYRITSNPVERSILWTMTIPEDISMTSSERIDVSYVLIIYEAEEFCNHVVNESLFDHIESVQHLYPHHTICYLTNRLMAYINKREQAQYKNHTVSIGWKRPAIEEVFSKLATNFFKVHSRQCVDEAELAEHVVGLTCSLASCQFRKKLTRLSVNANGLIIPKDCVDKNLIKNSLWLKALVAIPKVQPRFAIAIWKKYPTMKSLLSVYIEPTKSVHEKEFLLKDLITEGLFGDDRRLGEVCSKRIYRILMAQHGSIKTDDVENGADFFIHPCA